MRVAVTRAVVNVTGATAFFGTLFLFVVISHVGLTTALRASGANGGLALLISGGMVLALVAGATAFWNYRAQARLTNLQAERARLALPDGACCVVAKDLRASEMPWRIEDAIIHAAYPKVAQSLGVEGLAIVEFEIGADGKAHTFACLDVWPTRIFYDAAVEALKGAKFVPKEGAQPRFGVSYRVPFTFRIAGQARLRDRGLRARNKFWRLFTES
jgi:TonB family protein